MTLHLMYASGARFAPGARVIARHAGWERWVIYEADSGNASDDEAMAPQDERFEEVWYYNTESGDSTVRVPCATSSMRMRAHLCSVCVWVGVGVGPSRSRVAGECVRFFERVNVNVNVCGTV